MPAEPRLERVAVLLSNNQLRIGTTALPRAERLAAYEIDLAKKRIVPPGKPMVWANSSCVTGPARSTTRVEAYFNLSAERYNLKFFH